MKLYCSDCDNDTDFGVVIEKDFKVDSRGNIINHIEENWVYYCQICKKAVKKKGVNK